MGTRRWRPDYLRCANLDFVLENDGAVFAPFVCLSDLALSEALGWGLVRSETLADGCARCDFRFRVGGPTRISSCVPNVEAAIEASRSGAFEGARPAARRCRALAPCAR